MGGCRPRSPRSNVHLLVGGAMSQRCPEPGVSPLVGGTKFQGHWLSNPRCPELVSRDRTLGVLGQVPACFGVGWVLIWQDEGL